ncbi:hypothetical protein MOMA_08701 [Moraxella macacae 0408225]|uniref:Endoribonuclease YbeY n=1 Tax=Moraxella macacae 0408225 TaxID=1230338 RepID=L2F794_9GAMM|nr:rRNA maturation RNase YbeY [Moraxella macacae]ELA08626.1 hypothetical protein MOMA_08701 [Moraxella macacae 0408225]
MNNTQQNLSLDIAISFHDNLIDPQKQSDKQNFANIERYYAHDKIENILTNILDYLNNNPDIILPNLPRAWLKKPLALDIYVTEASEARAINFDARGKDYATNILSYPGDLTPNFVEILPNLPLGELVVCHEVVVKQAHEQQKSLDHHLTHLLVHGILHLMGFDHELGQQQQDEMEQIEIAVLHHLGIANPYE